MTISLSKTIPPFGLPFTDTQGKPNLQWYAWLSSLAAAQSGGSLLIINNLSDLANKATARSNLAVPGLTGSGASGTWGISISGNAGTATFATSAGSATTAGTATTVTTNANLTGPITSVGNTTSIAAQTGTGSTFVVQTSPTINSPTLTAPVLGTPASGALTNCTFPTLNQNTSGSSGSCTGNAATATLAATVTTNANLTGPITSVGNTTSINSQTGTGSTFVMSSSPTMVTPTIGVATATSLTFSSTSGIIGTTTNSSAAAGSVGEVISANSAVNTTNIVSGTPTNVLSLSLTAGNYDVYGSVGFFGGSTTTISVLEGWVNSVSATSPGAQYNAYAYPSGTPFVTAPVGMVVPAQPFSFSTTTTVYLSVLCGFSVSTLTAGGFIYARRRI